MLIGHVLLVSVGLYGLIANRTARNCLLAAVLIIAS